MHRWTLDEILECAESCRTYREFYTRFPLAYRSAQARNWLGAVIYHCGWEKIGDRVVNDPLRRKYDLYELMNTPASLYDDVLEQDITLDAGFP